MAISWCKVASNLDSHPKIRKAGRCGREVFLFALRRNAEPGNEAAGKIRAEELEPWYLADVLQMPECDAVTGVTAAVTAGLLVREGDHFVIAGWESEWSKDREDGRVRTAKWRERQKAKQPVTSRDVTECHTVTGDLEEKRREENRYVFGAEPSAPAKPTRARRLRADVPLPADWQPTQAHADKARAKRLDLTHEADQFRNDALAKGKHFADWSAAFHTWLGNAAKWRDERGNTRQGGPTLVGGIRKSEPL